jgi:hypothetical protein
MKRVSYLPEIFVILIALIGFNLNRILPESNGIGIVVACISLLVWAAIIFTSEDQFKIERFSFVLILIRVVMPFAALITTIIFYTFLREEPPQPRAKQVLEQKVNANECTSIRYGHFKILNDTIERFKSGDNDFEIRQGRDTFNVTWTDSCSFRTSKSNRSFEFYRIIDINGRQIFLERIRNNFKKEVIVQTKID